MTLRARRQRPPGRREMADRQLAQRVKAVYNGSRGRVPASAGSAGDGLQ